MASLAKLLRSDDRVGAPSKRQGLCGEAEVKSYQRERDALGSALWKSPGFRQSCVHQFNICHLPKCCSLGGSQLFWQHAEDQNYIRQVVIMFCLICIRTGFCVNHQTLFQNPCTTVNHSRFVYSLADLPFLLGWGKKGCSLCTVLQC